MNKKQIFMITRTAIIAALYVALTLALSNFSYGNIQFRVSEVLLILVFFDKRYSIALIIGCFIANCFSPMGLPDIIFGTLASGISILLMIITKKRLIATFWPVIINALIVGLELFLILDCPFALSALQVGIGEFVVVVVLGYPIFRILENNKAFLNLIGAEDYDGKDNIKE